MEPTPAAPQAGNDYNFIMNPDAPKKKGVLSGAGGDPFITKIIVLVGGALALIVVLWLAVTLLFGGRSNIDMLVTVVQREQEVIRLSEAGKDALGQELKNAALNTQLSVTSHQQAWTSFLDERGRTLSPEELNLQKDASIDSKLALAEQTSTFDTTYATVMRAQLEEYAGALKSTYDGTSNKEERAMLSAHYDEVQLLLDQWPS